MADDPTPQLAGRKAEAARNDVRILAAAREVFLADPKAPVSAVAERAGVGMSALYRRYGSKELMLRELCHEGLRRYITEAESALADHTAGWEAFVAFLRGVVEADVHTLTVRLAGTFDPTDEMGVDAARAEELTGELIDAAHDSGVLRGDFERNDVALLLELMSAVRMEDAARTHQLRERYLTLLLDGMRSPEPTPLPGPPPRSAELARRWERPSA